MTQSYEPPHIWAGWDRVNGWTTGGVVFMDPGIRLTLDVQTVSGYEANALRSAVEALLIAAAEKVAKRVGHHIEGVTQ